VTVQPTFFKLYIKEGCANWLEVTSKYRLGAIQQARKKDLCLIQAGHCTLFLKMKVIFPSEISINIYSTTYNIEYNILHRERSENQKSNGSVWKLGGSNARIKFHRISFSVIG
jgi:hypothetical protein